jgi:hypothetical protein
MSVWSARRLLHLRRDEEGSSLARDIDETILVHKGVRTFSDKNVESPSRSRSIRISFDRFMHHIFKFLTLDYVYPFYLLYLDS